MARLIQADTKTTVTEMTTCNNQDLQKTSKPKADALQKQKKSIELTLLSDNNKKLMLLRLTHQHEDNRRLEQDYLV